MSSRARVFHQLAHTRTEHRDNHCAVCCRESMTESSGIRCAATYLVLVRVPAFLDAVQIVLVRCLILRRRLDISRILLFLLAITVRRLSGAEGCANYECVVVARPNEGEGLSSHIHPAAHWVRLVPSSMMVDGGIDTRR